ncbi:tRNA (adenosine(37)-N6)-threonylcarbamoyltransferase complex dimerization subunit type 1 TsaB [uncultured Roseobacter sp.]|uniref:tRNA (adenosine(37)-N6)-threonylcarbamoyltransferase complex dimerization subunit type 1 TsaB n=1 Tax=uncultured Roseobacter sp. TaxID=114847 RepID=UPI0026196CA0|nr:tRNA (adenosine(37)-N6)-threonylcarbamoyltransferase complex dimerization subunit type 1 TsaB [uncultured Roseobacter sp.]
MTEPAPVTVLAFDTAAPHCAAAVLSDGQLVAHAEEPMQKGQAERLMSLCDDLLTSADLSFGALTAIGVGIGPGNFTGIRISVAAARGLALGLGVPAVGVSSFEALRYGHDGPCATAITARREQLYYQRFDGTDAEAPILVPAQALPRHAGPLFGATGCAPAFPIAEAIARLAADRYKATTERPAPLYLRPADAAPARDAPPVILP